MGKNQWQGTAIDVHWRTAGSVEDPDQILNFILEVADEAGNVVQRVPVEMRGSHIQGFIRDGDTVVVEEKRADGGLIFADRATNLTSGSVVRTRTRTCRDNRRGGNPPHLRGRPVRLGR